MLCRRFFEQPAGAVPPDNRAALHHEVTSASVPPGIVAYVDGIPVGWTRIMPRCDIPGIARNRALRRFMDDVPTVWWVTCFHEIGRTFSSRPVMRRNL